MATYADLRSELIAAMESWSVRTRMVSDLREDLERIDAGQTRYQLQVYPAEKIYPDSNVPRSSANVTITTHHLVADAFDERAWTEGQMDVDLDRLANIGWWRALSAVRDLSGEIEVEVVRVVNLVTYQVTATAVLA